MIEKTTAAKAMKKILVIGSGGAGKSTFARRLSAITGIKVVHLDKLYWRSDWVEPLKEEWKETLEKAMCGEAWIMDGNYSGTFEMRLAVCDTVIFLDLPRTICVYRIIKRVALSYGKTRPDMAENCFEKFDWEFIKWIWNFGNRSKPKMERLLKQFKTEKMIVRLKSRGEIENFLMNYPQTSALK